MAPVQLPNNITPHGVELQKPHRHYTLPWHLSFCEKIFANKMCGRRIRELCEPLLIFFFFALITESLFPPRKGIRGNGANHNVSLVAAHPADDGRRYVPALLQQDAAKKKHLPRAIAIKREDARCCRTVGEGGGKSAATTGDDDDRIALPVQRGEGIRKNNP